MIITILLLPLGHISFNRFVDFNNGVKDNYQTHGLHFKNLNCENMRGHDIACKGRVFYKY
jgi:hypothetical protein